MIFIQKCNLRPLLVIPIFLTAMHLSSCDVRNSREYKELQEQLDSLQGSYTVNKNQLDDIFGALNEIESGLEQIRQTENILTIESQEEGYSQTQKEKIESNISAIKSAIENYQKKIAELKNDATIKSVEFKKRLNKIERELSEKSALIDKLQGEIALKEQIIQEKEETIIELDNTVTSLKEDIDSLSTQNSQLAGTVMNQEKEIHAAYYIVGTKDELIKQGILTKGGLFTSSKISFQGEKSAYIKIDYREISAINTNSAKAKVLSIHPKETYTIETINDEAIVTILNPALFWEQTKFLVIQTQ